MNSQELKSGLRCWNVTHGIVPLLSFGLAACFACQPVCQVLLFEKGTLETGTAQNDGNACRMESRRDSVHLLLTQQKDVDKEKRKHNLHLILLFMQCLIPLIGLSFYFLVHASFSRFWEDAKR